MDISRLGLVELELTQFRSVPLIKELSQRIISVRLVCKLDRTLLARKKRQYINIYTTT
jgi:hypothetical protein